MITYYSTKPTAVNAFEQKLDIAEQQLARHPFLAGDAFSLADIQFGHVRGCKIICVNGIFSKTFKGLQNAYQQRAY